MASTNILGKKLPIDFGGSDVTNIVAKDELIAQADKMAALINGIDWSDDQRAAFTAMDRIVFFKGEVSVNSWRVSRPCCDEDDATFYWEVGEFLQNQDADVHANTLFHDCWHVMQFRRAGNKYAADEHERVQREIDAINRQIEVARKLGCSDLEIAYLEGFRDSQSRIELRLAQGVTPDGGRRNV